MSELQGHQTFVVVAQIMSSHSAVTSPNTVQEIVDTVMMSNVLTTMKTIQPTTKVILFTSNYYKKVAFLIRTKSNIKISSRLLICCCNW